MENNLKIKTMTAAELGWTEDEYNNFLIDCHLLMQGKLKVTPENFKNFYGWSPNGEISDGAPKSITITINKANRDI